MSHPGPGVLKPSIASLVWSHDNKGAQYVAFTRVQSPREESIVDLQAMVSEAIVKFGDKNKIPPARIVFFRDGISEGEFEKVGNTEIGAIKGNTPLKHPDMPDSLSCSWDR